MKDIYVQKQKVNIIEFRMFKLVLIPNFSLNWPILIFLTRFAKKEFFWSKAVKVNTTYFLHNAAYSN